MKNLDYQFKDISLLEAALTHRSVKGFNNERLEFLGDSIVNFIIAEALYHMHPQACEGELSRSRASLVKGETLAKLAKHFKLNKFLRLGVGEIKSGGAQRESLLADAMEAIIAAIYIDSGFEQCQTLVLKWYDEYLQKISLISHHNLKDPKTKLQEFLQSQRHPLPQYTLIYTEGEAHDQIFYIECTVEGMFIKASGEGKSRRKAEQAAAENFLAKLADAK